MLPVFFWGKSARSPEAYDACRNSVDFTGRVRRGAPATPFTGQIIRCAFRRTERHHFPGLDGRFLPGTRRLFP